MEGLISAEVEKICRFYEGTAGRPISLNQTINVSIVNALWTILVGDSFQLDDPRLTEASAKFFQH